MSSASVDAKNDTSTDSATSGMFQVMPGDMRMAAMPR